MKAHYPDWGITKNLRVTFEEIHRSWLARRRQAMTDRDARPYISVATPVWNAAATVRRTLEAAQRQKASFDHVVYDGEAPIIRGILFRSSSVVTPSGSCRVKPRRVWQRGQRSPNHRGEIMGWINGDDFYLPYTLSMVERIFQPVRMSIGSSAYQAGFGRGRTFGACMASPPFSTHLDTAGLASGKSARLSPTRINVLAAKPF